MNPAPLCVFFLNKLINKKYAFFSCLYDLSNPTVFESGITVFNHYILTAKLFSPIACNFFSTLLLLFIQIPTTLFMLS